MRTILAISSGGGHWIQLQRLVPAFGSHTIVWASVDKNPKIKDGQMYKEITDANFDTRIKLVKSFLEIFFLVKNIRPAIIITTGAAPGFFAIFWGKVYGARTIWIDSIANAGKLSLSGRLALYFADTILTQWPNLAKGKIHYHGAVI